MKIKSKRNGLIIDALPYTETSVKVGNGKFAEYVNGKQQPIDPDLQKKPTKRSKPKPEKEDEPTAEIEIL